MKMYIYRTGTVLQPFGDDVSEAQVLLGTLAEAQQRACRRHGIELVRIDNPSQASERPCLLAADYLFFTEKALALTVEECDRIIEAVENAGIKFMISLPSRCSPDILLAKKVVEEGIIGEITMGRGRIAHSAALDGWFPPGNWFGDPKRAGGGALFDLGCHRVDVIRWLMGEPKSVLAKINNFTHRYDIDDNSVTLVEFENNAIGIIDVTWIHRSGPNMLELYGTEGSLIIGHPKGIVLTSTRFSSEEEAQRYIRENRPQPLPSPMQQWISAILHGTPMTITIQDGRNLTELLQAAYISAAEGREVRLPL